MTTQKQTMMALFNTRPNQWIPLPEILAMGIAQYNARILELRRDGFDIENKTKKINGQKHSWFRYNPTGQKEFKFEEECHEKVAVGAGDVSHMFGGGRG